MIKAVQVQTDHQWLPRQMTPLVKAHLIHPNLRITLCTKKESETINSKKEYRKYFKTIISMQKIIMKYLFHIRAFQVPSSIPVVFQVYS